MSFYFDKQGRRYKGKSRICYTCGYTEIVRDSNLSKNCSTCHRKTTQSYIDPSWILKPYFDSSGNKYKGRLRTCDVCGNRKVVRISVKSNLCKPCRTRDRKSTPKIYVEQNGKKRGAEHRKCKECGKTRLCRKDNSNESKMCVSCRGSFNGKKWNPSSKRYESRKEKYKAVPNSVREQFKHFKKNCLICKKEGRIVIHHIDENPQNNDISNLMPLCYSCHSKIHVRLNKGLTHENAFKDVIQSCHIKIS